VVTLKHTDVPYTDRDCSFVRSGILMVSQTTPNTFASIKVP